MNRSRILLTAAGALLLALTSAAGATAQGRHIGGDGY